MSASAAHGRRRTLGLRAGHWLRQEARLLDFAALLLLATLSPRTYDRATLEATAQTICRSSWRILPGYALLTVLLAAVATRIVSTTAASYGLSYLALEAVVGVLVVELIPLVAALFVALHSGLDAMHRLGLARSRGARASDLATVRLHAVPAVVGNAFAVVALSVVSGLLTLIVAYLIVHGLTPWGLDGYTRLVGQVFDQITMLDLAVKVVLFALVVGLSPATVLLDLPSDGGRRDVRVMVRLLMMLVAIEGAILALKRF